jgi:hypothetical protein
MTVVEPPTRRVASRVTWSQRPPTRASNASRGEPLRRILDLGTLHPGSDVPALYERLDLSALALGQAVVSLTNMAPATGRHRPGRLPAPHGRVTSPRSERRRGGRRTSMHAPVPPLRRTVSRVRPEPRNWPGGRASPSWSAGEACGSTSSCHRHSRERGLGRSTRFWEQDR